MKLWQLLNNTNREDGHVTKINFNARGIVRLTTRMAECVYLTELSASYNKLVKLSYNTDQ